MFARPTDTLRIQRRTHSDFPNGIQLLLCVEIIDVTIADAAAECHVAGAHTLGNEPPKRGREGLTRFADWRYDEEVAHERE
jgi:hypothetical protein